MPGKNKSNDVSKALAGLEVEVSPGRLLEMGESHIGRREGKHKHKVALEIRRGHEYDSERRVMQKERVTDRANDRYCETIIDEATGKVVHHVEEPLSEHTEH